MKKNFKYSIDEHGRTVVDNEHLQMQIDQHISGGELHNKSDCTNRTDCSKTNNYDKCTNTDVCAPSVIK